MSLADLRAKMRLRLPLSAGIIFSSLLSTIGANAQSIITTQQPSNVNPLKPATVSFPLIEGCFNLVTNAGIPNCTITNTSVHHVDGSGDHKVFNPATGEHPLPPDFNATDARTVGIFDFPTYVTDANGQIKGKYTMPEVAGTVDFTATCTCPTGQNPSYEFQIVSKVFSLVALPTNNPGYVPDPTTSEHSDSGSYVHPTVANELGLVPVQFQVALGSAVQAPTLHYTSESLAQGGLFDLCGHWSRAGFPGCPFQGGHNLHRRGTSADVAMRNIPASERRALRKTIYEVGLSTPVSYESIANPTANHWHIEQK